MKKIVFSDKIKNAAPSLKVVQVCASCSNPPTSDSLWKEIEEVCTKTRESFRIEDISRRPAIAATRKAYKALGKEPNRYRPSSEAMCRRIVSGKGLYRLTTLIDAVNLISVATGYSIGGFDADKIEGDTLLLDRGEAADKFCGIGRGPLNVDGLPLYRDAAGGIGTPTSDEERTKLTPDTHNLLMLINVYGEETAVSDTLARVYSTLSRHASLTEFEARLHIAATGETFPMIFELDE